MALPDAVADSVSGLLSPVDVPYSVYRALAPSPSIS